MRASLVNYSRRDVYIQALPASCAWHPDDASQIIDALKVNSATLWDQDLPYSPGAPTAISAAWADGSLGGDAADRRIGAYSSARYLSLRYQNVENLNRWAEPLRRQFGFTITVTIGPEAGYDADHPGTNGCILQIGR